MASRDNNPVDPWDDASVQEAEEYTRDRNELLGVLVPWALTGAEWTRRYDAVTPDEGAALDAMTDRNSNSTYQPSWKRRTA